MCKGSCIGFVLWSCVACAASPATVRHEHHVEGTILLEAENYRVRGYDPDDPRLVRAEEALAEVLGRHIVVRFNVKLMPRAEDFFEHFFDQEIGKLPRVFAEWKRAKPADFADMTAALRHVDFDFDGSQPNPSFKVDAPPARLLVVLNSRELPRSVLNGALARLQRRSLARRYLDQSPENIAAADRLPYLEALTQFGAAYFWQAIPETPHTAEPSGGRSEVALRLLALQAVAKDSDAELSRRLVDSLIDYGSYLRSCYEGNDSFLRGLPTTSRFFRAEQAWMKWALPALDTLEPEQRYALYDLMIVPNRSSPRTVTDMRAFPGFSIVTKGYALLDEWARAGYPTAAASSEPSADAKTRLYDRVLCPTAPDWRGLPRRTPPNCRHEFWATAVSASDSCEVLLARAIATPDATLFREVALNIHMLANSNLDFPQPTAIAALTELWRRSESTPARFRELTRMYGAGIDGSTKLREALYDQATRYYRTKADYRGELLFLLARIDGYGRTEVNWKNFAATYGAAIGERELGVYLEQSYLAFQTFHRLADALPRDSSPGLVVARRLRRYLADPNAEADGPSGRVVVLRSIGQVLQRIGDRAGLEAFANELRGYVGADPARERTYRDVMAELDSLRQAPARKDHG